MNGQKSLVYTLFLLAVNQACLMAYDQPGGARTRISEEMSLSILHKLAFTMLTAVVLWH